MNVQISDNWQRFIQGALESGRYSSADEVLDEALRLLEARDLARAEPPDGDRSEVASPHKPIWEVFQEISSSIPEEEWDKLPTDSSEQLDHYVYGTPKRPAL